MTQIAAALFAWDAVEARSDLERFYLVRDHLPDRDLIAALEAKRGLGRDDYPVIPMWNAIVAGVVFQHESIELLQRELSRILPCYRLVALLFYPCKKSRWRSW